MTDPHGADSAEIERLTRPIIGMENRTSLEVFDIMSDRIRSALCTPSDDVVKASRVKMVPTDDDNRSFSDSLLPAAMIEAGEEVWDRAQEDMNNYVPGETIDWDTGMIVVAIYRAMIAAAPSVAPDDAVKLRETSGNALSDIAAERERQIGSLGWAPEHDDGHDRGGALPRAAACYALADHTQGQTGPFFVTHLQTPRQVWPGRWEWKPKDRRTNLVRAAALIVAEIERLDRAALKGTPNDAG